MLLEVFQIAGVLLQYWLCLSEFIFFPKKRYADCILFTHDTHARVQIFSLALIFRLWSEPHYRTTSFQQDMLNNLKNVAVPGTGIPLSHFCHHKILALFFVFFINPFLSFLGAVNQAALRRRHVDDFMHLLAAYFTKNLLHPDDWFSLWRLNCRLVSYHSLITGSQDYRLEDKWTFLVQGKEMGVPVSPFDTQTETLVCKNKLIEGGMGIHFYHNAAFGGEWILQEKLQNASWLQQLLPTEAPLSTMRVITSSSFTLSEEYPLKKVRSLLASSTILSDEEDEDGGVFRTPRLGTESSSSPEDRERDSSSHPNNGNSHRHLSASTDTDHQSDQEAIAKYIRAESAVLRLGRSKARTDHACILFPVDMDTGEILEGTTNSHWYELGLDKVLNTSWLPPNPHITHHLDAPYPRVAGERVPDIAAALEIVRR